MARNWGFKQNDSPVVFRGGKEQDFRPPWRGAGCSLSLHHLVWKVLMPMWVTYSLSNLLSRPDTNPVPSSVGWWLWVQLQLHRPLP